MAISIDFREVREVHQPDLSRHQQGRSCRLRSLSYIRKLVWREARRDSRKRIDHTQHTRHCRLLRPEFGHLHLNSTALVKLEAGDTLKQLID